MAKKYGRQSVASDVSTTEQALGYVDHGVAPKAPAARDLATKDAKTQKGYTKLGTGGFPRDGKPHAKDNRGEGSA